jgi:hypothetical protein
MIKHHLPKDLHLRTLSALSGHFFTLSWTFPLCDRLLEPLAGRATPSELESLYRLTNKNMVGKYSRDWRHVLGLHFVDIPVYSFCQYLHGHRSVIVINMIRLSISSLNKTDSMKSCLFPSAAIHGEADTVKTIIVVGSSLCD